MIEKPRMLQKMTRNNRVFQHRICLRPAPEPPRSTQQKTSNQQRSDRRLMDGSIHELKHAPNLHLLEVITQKASTPLSP
jgi:hypothetical protein